MNFVEFIKNDHELSGWRNLKCKIGNVHQICKRPVIVSLWNYHFRGKAPLNEVLDVVTKASE
jgi:hypothetical protein